MSTAVVPVSQIENLPAATMPEYRITDRILDALDDAPRGSVEGGISFVGRLATIQQLSTAAGCSDTTTRSAVLQLLEAGMVEAFTAVDPLIGRRRIFVTGGV